MTEIKILDDKQAFEAFQKLNERAQRLNNNQIQINTRIEDSKKELATLQQQALAEFGVSDIEGLRDELARRRKHNSEQVAILEQTITAQEEEVNECMSMMG